MAKPALFDYPTFKPTKIPAVRVAHWKPVTVYTRWRWLVQAVIVLAFVVVPYMRWLKLDFTHDQYWLLGHEVSMVIALQAVVVLWFGTYFINFFENYLVGRLLCGWICPWGLLNRLGMIINHRLRRHPHRPLVLATGNLVFATAATLVVMNWMIDLGTLVTPTHAYFGFTLGHLRGPCGSRLRHFASNGVCLLRDALPVRYVSYRSDPEKLVAGGL